MSLDYSQPQKLPPIALFRVFGRVVKAVLTQAWPVILVYFFQVKSREPGDENPFFIYIVYAILFLTVVGGVIRYLTFRWSVDGDALIIRHGVFKKVDLRIPFDRIQAIDLQQPWYYQLGNAARFVVDTAGSKSKEAEIWALSMSDAAALRTYIHERKGEEAEAHVEDVNVPVQEKTWVALDLNDLFKIGLFRNHFRSIAAFIGGAFYLYSQLQDVLDPDEVNREIQEVASWIPKTGSVFAVLGVLMITAAVVFSVVLTVFLFYGFKLTERNGSLIAKYGLTSVKTRHLKPNKVQVMRTEQGPVFKALGILRFKIEQAYAEKTKAKEDFSIPGSPMQMVVNLKHRLFGEVPKQQHPGTSFKWFWYRVVRIGILPIIAPLVVGYYLDLTDFYFTALWLPFQVGYSYLLWKNQGIAIDDTTLSIRRQVIFDKRSTLLLNRVQAVQVQQSIYQRKHALATLTVETAGGSVTLPFIPKDKADALANYLLYKSEIAHLNWM